MQIYLSVGGFFVLKYFQGTVLKIEKALINVRFRVLKVP